METPGEYFKRERALRGVNIQKIFEVTRAPLKYLEAIEADDLEALPSPIFVKGYIRAYCKYLGLDANDAILRYEIFLKEKTEKPAETPDQFESNASKRISAVPANAVKAAAIAAVALAVIISVYFVSAKGKVKPLARPSNTVSVETAPPATGTVEAQTPVARGHERDKAPPGPVNTQASFKKDIAAPAHSTKAHTLTLKAVRTVWVRVALDDKEPAEATFKEGDSFTWKAERLFSMRFGDAGAVSLILDNVDMGTPGKSGQVLDIRLPVDKTQPPQAAVVKKLEERPKTAVPQQAPKSDDGKSPVAGEKPEKTQAPKPADAPDTMGTVRP
ncbi:MAG: DUF4115 domain-containing protein [Deltaproteobacteria bacterium]|nr:DUF4115 domain-containing protein [Deltaproteobacteria bacterium]